MACQWNAASVFSICLRTKPAAFVPLIILQAILGISLAAQAQTLSVLHNFTGQGDGDGPFAGVTLISRAGSMAPPCWVAATARA